MCHLKISENNKSRRESNGRRKYSTSPHKSSERIARALHDSRAAFQLNNYGPFEKLRVLREVNLVIKTFMARLRKIVFGKSVSLSRSSAGNREISPVQNNKHAPRRIA